MAVISKIDLLLHVPFDVDLAIEFVRSIDPPLQVLQVSALTGADLPEWYSLLRESVVWPGVVA